MSQLNFHAATVQFKLKWNIFYNIFRSWAAQGKMNFRTATLFFLFLFFCCMSNFLFSDPSRISSSLVAQICCCVSRASFALLMDKSFLFTEMAVNENDFSHMWDFCECIYAEHIFNSSTFWLQQQKSLMAEKISSNFPSLVRFRKRVWIWFFLIWGSIYECALCIRMFFFPKTKNLHFRKRRPVARLEISFIVIPMLN